MITYVHDPTRAPESGGIYHPLIVCDSCLQPINNGHGNTYWLVSDDGEIHPQIWHTHKGVCALYDRTIEATHRGMALWEELRVWLDQLGHNIRRPLPGPERVGRPE